ncbi:ankyrin repeat domain-containing protein 66 isoform X1 [Phyllopteryx taeniolatus]|uniref:ankyrin repeat domain-containing protein 66 isoform X1 n=1 Tax=Phyllopteryx taeniolatus TaxID=161469 RepID=UPI002AD5B356|nr:ankyrin repeat domain-containing protein 66 isoform X1 [Phyllopteryx taeniolatus]
MEAAKGVLSHLSALEVRAKSRHITSRSRAEELRRSLKALNAQRDRLKAEIHTLKDIEKRKTQLYNRCADEEVEAEDGETEQLLHLMARQTQLKELLDAHHITGGYNVTKTRRGKGVCLTLATAYEGVYLDTYNLELDMRPTLKISRHNVPPFIPLSDLGERAGLQDDLRGFLYALGTHLNAFVGRRQQLRLVKELHPSVIVMESNAPCSILVLMLSVPRENKTLLCTLNYTDHTSYLPTGVRFDCEDENLPESPEWKNNRKLLMEMPVHRVLGTLKNMDHIG